MVIGKSDIVRVCGIYGLRSKTTGKWYVGQSLNIRKRWEVYRNLRCKGQEKLYRALLKYGYNDFEKLVFEECENIDWILDYREIYWIRILNSVVDGYNIREGGSHGKMTVESRMKMSLAKKGRRISDITRQRMSAAQKRVARDVDWCSRLGKMNLGRKMSDETKQKLSTARTGIRVGPHSAEHRQKISESCMGRTVSDATREKMSEAHRNRWKRIKEKETSCTKQE